MNKGILILSCLFLALPGMGQGQSFYDVNTINTIELIFEESNWDQILDDLFAAGEEERLVCTAMINGVQFDSVGVRYKGNSSYRRNQKKNPLNIKLDHIIDDQELDGYGTLKLANAFKDPTFVREVISYEIARKYMPASEANFASVYINGELIGFYTSVQSVDKYFANMHFGSRDNAFFKGELTHDSPQNRVKVWGYLGVDSTDYTHHYELRSDYGWGDFIEFLDVFNNNSDDVEEYLNVDNHLWMLAFDILMVNLDAPINFGHNFYLYQDGSGRFNPIMWDLNENFGVFVGIIGGGQLNISGLQQLDPFFNIANPDYPIVHKILTNPTYRKMYIAHMKTLIEENFSNGWFLDRVLEIQEFIHADVQADPNKLYSYTGFKDNVYNSAGNGPMSIIGLMELMDARLAFLSNHSAFQGTAPSISNIAYSPLDVSSNSPVWFSAEIRDANLVQLGYRHGISGRFEKVQMFDDGNHNDGAAADGVYGISIDLGMCDIQYYIYAENGKAVMFSPQRAEYEFYTINVTGNVVINEFMASNDRTAADQNGEYDDWVELYNNSEHSVSLDGYYLTDDAGNLTRWAFPDTSIEACGYLIIWTDSDEAQDGLHTNFKLSASGEAVLLVNPDQSIVDEVTFGQQRSDFSEGRYPNGTGNFIEMDPTFSSENRNGITGVDDPSFQLVTNFILEQNVPNPFNPSTIIRFYLPHEGRVSLVITNVNGQKLVTLVDTEKRAGYHEIEWNGSDLPSGVYFYRISVTSHDSKTHFTDVKKMILIK